MLVHKARSLGKSATMPHRIRALMERDPSLTAEGAQGLITQFADACTHNRRTGGGGLSSSGGYSEWTCLDCGAHERTEFSATRD